MAERRLLERRPDGSLTLRLDAVEADLLLALLDELRGVLGGPADHEILVRLFPRAYLDPTEERAEEELRAFTRADLMRERLDAIDEIDAVLRPARDTHSPGAVSVRLAAGAEERWLGVINDLRLVLGEILGVSDDDGPPEAQPDDPGLRRRVVYDWLSAFEAMLVDLLLGELD